MACVIENSKVPEMQTEEWRQFCERKQPVESKKEEPVVKEEVIEEEKKEVKPKKLKSDSNVKK